ncbi:hypothetical protein D6829_01260 [Candidatus Pacearchaeota archaeon]|nr:MAG: hypothetical protein D6829_01260 [Candidatus Pacearchaeota archaeon]
MEKCALCGEKLEKTFLEKVVGTSVKVGSGPKSKIVWVCRKCQKENGNLLVEKVKEKVLPA